MVRYVVVKEERVAEGRKEIWWLVVPKSKILRLIEACTFFLGGWDEYRPFLDLEEAKRCADLLTKRKYDYTKDLGVVYNSKEKR